MTGSRSRASARPPPTSGRPCGPRATATRSAGWPSRAPRRSRPLVAIARRAGLGSGGRPRLDVLLRLNPDVDARDPGRPGRRSRDLEVRHDRDRADGDRRRDRGRRAAPGARHPPPRRLPAGRGRRVARRRAPGPGAARAHRRGPRRLRHVRRRRRLPGRRPGHGPDARPLRRARSSRCSTRCRPTGGPPAWPSSPAGSWWRGAGWLVARVLHVRERAGAERVVVLDAGMTELIRPALYGATHPIVALTSLGRPLDDAGREPSGAVVASTDRSRRRPDLREHRHPRHPRPAPAPTRRPRRDRRGRRVRGLDGDDLQRPAGARPGAARGRRQLTLGRRRGTIRLR